MKFKIIPTKQFAKDFIKIKDKKVQKEIKDKIEEVSYNPTRYKRLHYDLKGSFRIRVEVYRVIYSVNIELEEMYLEKIVFGHKY
jgi:mRNA-degrading endonuclease RelE of RelBE toxin-antitoxin system